MDTPGARYSWSLRSPAPARSSSVDLDSSSSTASSAPPQRLSRLVSASSSPWPSAPLHHARLPSSIPSQRSTSRSRSSSTTTSIPPSPSIPLAPLPPSLELCTPKQAWQTIALILVPLIFNQLGAVMSPQPVILSPHAAGGASATPSSPLDPHLVHHQHPHSHVHLHHQYPAQQSHSFVTLASILERSPLFFVFLSSWWVDFVVLLALIGLLRYVAFAGGRGVTPAFEGDDAKWKTALHVFSFFSTFFNVRQSSALVSTVFMLLASTAKAKSDTIDREAARLTDGRAYPLCTRLVSTMWWALIFGTTDIAFLLPHLACLLIASSFFSSSIRFKFAIGVASCFLMFPMLVVVSYMMDTVGRSVLHFAFAPRSVVFSRYFSSDVMLLQSASFIYNIILTAKIATP